MSVKRTLVCLILLVSGTTYWIRVSHAEENASERSAIEGNAQHGNETAPDHSVIFGLGGATDRDLGDGAAGAGTGAFVEIDAIEGALEIEIGGSSFALKEGRELAADVLFKTPVWASRHLLFYVGGGPQFVQFTRGSDSGTSPGLEAAVELMYWPTDHFGFYAEPSYELVFRKGTETALDLSAGILVGW